MKATSQRFSELGKRDYQLAILVAGFEKVGALSPEQLPSTREEAHSFYVTLITAMHGENVISEEEWRVLASPPYPVDDPRLAAAIKQFKSERCGV
jgi:hypothetical protein